MAKLTTISRIVTLDDVEDNWWNKLKEPVPERMQCKDAKCTFAPPGHKKHNCVEPRSNMTLEEKRLIIQYLNHNHLIRWAKGDTVWIKMIASGYLTHRTKDSLRNHFQRHMLPNIEDYKLPTDLENQFLQLRMKV